jgi:hypothetical protein
MNENIGHGHVFPRPDGVKARCGGPAICMECAGDQARKAKASDLVHSEAFVQMFLGYLSGAIPELGKYPPARLLGVWECFKGEMQKR